MSDPQPIDKFNSGCLLMQLGGPEIVVERDHAVARRPEVDLNKCDTCEGQGWIPEVDEKGYRVLHPCPGERMDHRIDLFNAAHLPARYANASLGTFEPRLPEHPSLLHELERYLAGFAPGQQGRLFMGGVGTGKTHMLVACLRYLTLEKGIPCRFVEFTHLLSELRAAYSSRRSDTEILGPLAKIPVLAIDELGKGRSNDFELRIVDELVSRRYNDTAVTTFFTTNYYPAGMNAGDASETLSDRIGERVESRLYQMCEFIPMAGGDYRRQLYSR